MVLAGLIAAVSLFAAPARGEEGIMQITSPEFEHGQPIPPGSSCDGEDRSPALAWTDPPEGTKSFVLIMDDPDAPVGTWDHWLLYDIPATSRGLPAGVPAAERLPEGGTHGENSWGRNDYGGPCPPGGTHRYFFKLYALDAVLELPPGTGKKALQKAMAGRVLAEAELMGTYRRG